MNVSLSGLDSQMTLQKRSYIQTQLEFRVPLAASSALKQVDEAGRIAASSKAPHLHFFKLWLHVRLVGISQSGDAPGAEVLA